MDALSPILDRLRLSAKVYFQESFDVPWGMEMNRPPYEQFHVVVRGDCWLTGDDFAAMRLTTGDSVLVREGTSHALRSDRSAAVQAGEEILERIREGTHLQPTDPNTATTLICGHFEWRDRAYHPLHEALPSVIRVTGAEQSSGWLQSITTTLIDEMSHGRPGSETLSNRLAECLYIQVLRTYLGREPRPAGVLAALKDPALSLALSGMHRELAFPWSVNSLAKTAGMSRAAFARRFKQAVGEAPMGYLSRCRMHEAKTQITETRSPLQRIAENVGFASSASFSAAFMKHFGRRPGALRSSRGQKKGAIS